MTGKQRHRDRLLAFLLSIARLSRACCRTAPPPRRKADSVLHVPFFRRLVQFRLGKGRIGAENYLLAQPLLAFNKQWKSWLRSPQSCAGDDRSAKACSGAVRAPRSNNRKSRAPNRQRDPCGRSANVADEAGDNQAQELFNRAANLFRQPPTGLIQSAMKSSAYAGSSAKASLPTRGRTRQTGPGVELGKVSSALHSPARQDARHCVRIGSPIQASRI